MELLSLTAAVALLAGNFFFVAVEFAVTRARPSMVDELVERGVSGSGSLKHAVDHIDAYLSACQLGITICSIGLGITAEPLVSHALEGVLPEGDLLGVGSTAIAFALAYFVVSMFHVVLGELTPKSLAIGRTRATGLLLVPPMRVFYLATKPIVDLFNWMGNVVLKPFGIPPASESGHDPHSEQELRRLIAESREEGQLAPHEERFAEGVFTFGDRRAREVMVARTDIAVLTADLSPAEAARRMLGVGHTRLPLCEPGAGLEEALGFVHVLDVVAPLTDGSDRELRDVARPLRRVPESILLDELLAEMRSAHEHVALVEDEHGTVTGLVTLEDVLEEIVGDISDEFDAKTRRPVREEDGALVVEGSTPLRQVATELGLRLEEHREATIGGYVVELAGRVPEQGAAVEVAGRRARVTAVDGTRVTELRFELPGPDDEEDAASG